MTAKMLILYNIYLTKAKSNNNARVSYTHNVYRYYILLLHTYFEQQKLNLYQKIHKLKHIDLNKYKKTTNIQVFNL